MGAHQPYQRIEGSTLMGKGTENLESQPNHRNYRPFLNKKHLPSPETNRECTPEN